MLLSLNMSLNVKDTIFAQRCAMHHFQGQGLAYPGIAWWIQRVTNGSSGIAIPSIRCVFFCVARDDDETVTGLDWTLRCHCTLKFIEISSVASGNGGFLKWGSHTSSILVWDVPF